MQNELFHKRWIALGGVLGGLFTAFMVYMAVFVLQRQHRPTGLFWEYLVLSTFVPVWILETVRRRRRLWSLYVIATIGAIALVGYFATARFL